MTFRVSRRVGNTLFRRLQLVSSSLMAFSHGSNDAQKVMGIITLALVSGGLLERVEVPTWVISAGLIASLGRLHFHDIHTKCAYDPPLAGGGSQSHRKRTGYVPLP